MMTTWRVIPRNHRVATAAWTMMSALLLAGCADAPDPAGDPPPTVRLDGATPPSGLPRTTPTHSAVPEPTAEWSGTIKITTPATIKAETSAPASDPLTVAAVFVIAVSEQYTDPARMAQLADLATPELLATLQQPAALTGPLQPAEVSVTITSTDLLARPGLNSSVANIRVAYTVRSIDTDHVRTLTAGQAMNLTLTSSGQRWAVSAIAAAAG